MSPVRVLTLIDRLGPRGGAERLAVQIATRLDPERFESHFCASRYDALEREDEGTRQARARLAEAGVRFLGIGRERKTDIHKWSELVRYLRRERIDVLHAHKHGSNVWAAALAPLVRTPVLIAHEHTWSYEGESLRRFLDRELVSRWADAFIAVSREDQRRMTSVEGIPPERTVFIPNGALIPPRDGPAGDLRAELGLPADAPLIGSAGFLRPQKAFEVLVEAAATVRERHPGVRVLIAGEGDERERLEADIAARGLQDTVLLLGRRLDVPDVLENLDVAVCCSDFEGSPVSVMEYMEAALPVVATRVGGVPDLIDDGVHGRLVASRDAHGLGMAIADLLDNPERAARMGQTGRERRRREFDLDVMVGRLQELYAERLAAARRGRARRRR